MYVFKFIFVWKLLQDCIDAINGTHIKAQISTEHQRLFRGRKNECTHNIMAICDFDMLFTFVYIGWEGTANDDRIFKDTVTTDQGFEWPTND
jgi:hypothetical protein